MRSLVLVVALAGCEAASPDPGIGTMLQVQGAQFRPGAFPADTGGPDTFSLLPKRSGVVVGAIDDPVQGILDGSARGFALGLVGYDGAWLLPAGPADVGAPNSATAKAVIGVAREFPPGTFTLELAASDASGHFGAPATADIVAMPRPDVSGELVIGLTWSTRADLDLHVVDPANHEAFSGDPNTAPAPIPGDPVGPQADEAGCILDHDGNADCHLDGDPSEHVVWQMPPPDGHYTVRVDIRDACGDGSTAWSVYATRQLTVDTDPALIGRAEGISTPDEVQLPHEYGAGVLALQFACDASGCRP